MNKKMPKGKIKVILVPLICVLMLLIPSKLDFDYEQHKRLDGIENIKLKIGITYASKYIGKIKRYG